jgi:tetratricopeptide (TPR) repeat protein
MLRPAPAVLVVVLLAACGGTPTPPAPTKVEQSTHPVDQQPIARDPHNPFRRPDRDPPPPRSEPQIPAAELDAALAAAAAARTAGDDAEVARVLFPCANKIPKSTRCEGELAMALAGSPGRKAEVQYFLDHAIADDDPGADADFYARLADTLLRQSMQQQAAVALQRRLARLPEPSAADYARLSEVLQGVPQREVEAAELLQQAFERDPTKLQYLRDAGMLLSQVPGRGAEALVLLERYRDAIRGIQPEEMDSIERRIAQVRSQLEPAPKAAPATAPAQGRRANRGTPD